MVAGAPVPSTDDLAARDVRDDVRNMKDDFKDEFRQWKKFKKFRGGNAQSGNSGNANGGNINNKASGEATITNNGNSGYLLFLQSLFGGLTVNRQGW